MKLFFDFITIEKIFFEKSIFVSDRTIILKLNKCDNEIYGKFITIQ